MWRRGAVVDRHRWRQRLRLLSYLAPKWRFLHVQRLISISCCQTGREKCFTDNNSWQIPEICSSQIPLPAAVGLWAGEALQGLAGQLGEAEPWQAQLPLGLQMQQTALQVLPEQAREPSRAPQASLLLQT